MFAHVDPQTLKCFLNEMQDQPQQVRAVLAMDAPEAADWAQAARLVHAAKGAAAMIGLQPLSHLCFQLEEAFRDAESHAGPVEPSAKQAMAALVDVLEHLFQAATEHLDTGPLSPQRNQELAQRVVEGVDQFRQARSLPDNEEWNELRRQLLTEPPATATPPESLVELLGDGKIQIDDPTFAALLAESDESPDDETLVAVQRLIREELDAVNQGLSTFLDEPDNTGVLSRVIQSSRAVGEAARTIQREHLASLADNFARALQCAAEDRISVSADFGETLLLALEAMFDGHESDDDAYIAELSGRLRALVHEAPPSPTAAVPAPESLPNVAEIAEQIEADLAGRENVSAELLEVFLEEADEHINAIYVDLERLGREPEARESLQSIRRAAHTLKGAAGAVKLTVVSRLAHRMEDLLDELYERQLPTTPSAVQLLLNATDALQDLATGEFNRETIGQLVAELYMQFGSAITGETDAPVAPVESAVPTAPEIEIEEQVEEDASETERVAAARRRDAAQPNRGPALRVPVARLDELVSLVSEMIINRTAFEQRMQDFIRFVDEMQPVLNRLRTASNDIETRYSVEALRGRGFGATDASWMRPSQSQISAERIEEFDELEFDRYTDFHLLSRSLAEATGDVATIANELRTLIGDFDSLLARQGRFTREAQDRLNRVRMVPLASLAARLHRAVRNVATQSGKQVELVLEGDDTALDKNVLDELSGALLHLVRNAVDHGVESPAERLAAGKPECGRLRVTAYPEGTQVIVKVRDDGAGLDVGKIRAAAVARGLVPQTEAEEMESQQLFGLIFLPGFSTAEQVSEISGRGVGMDVVRDTVQRLKGSVSVESTHGRGSTFTIRLPMTLAVTRALLVTANNQTFAIPLQAVTKIQRQGASDVSRLGGKSMLRLGGASYPLLSLAEHLTLPESSEAAPESPPLLIVRSNDQEVAVAVDRILFGRDVVVKTLGAHLQRVRGFIGATLLGDGAVVPILDPADFFQQEQSVAAPSVPARERARAGVTVMVVDDSVSVRRVVSNLIKSAGWTAIPAKDGVDALEQLRAASVPPDVILLDIEMPRMDGYELLSALRDQDPFRDLPVIMVTSRAGEKHRTKAFQLGATNYMVKPYQDEALLAMIRETARAAQETTS